MQDATTIGDNEAYDYIEQKVAESVQNKWPTLVESKVTEALSGLSNEVQSIEDQIGTGIDDENNTIKKNIASIDQDLQNIHINIEIIENTIGEDENASEHENETQTLYQKLNLLEEKVDTISSGDWNNLILKEEIEPLITPRAEKAANTDEIPLKNKNYYILDNNEYSLVDYLQDFQLVTVQENAEYNENYIYYIKEQIENTYEPYEYNENTWESDLETGNVFLLNGQNYTPIEPGAEYIEPDDNTSYWWRIINYEYNEYNYNENTWTENITLSLIEQCLFKENIEYYTDYEDIEDYTEIARIGGISIYDKLRIQNYYNEETGIEIGNINGIKLYTPQIDLVEVANNLSFSYSNLSDLPEFSDIAYTGNYSDLLNQPEIPELPNITIVAMTGDYGDLQNIPISNTFAINAIFDENSNELNNFSSGNCIVINNINRVKSINIPKNNILYNNSNNQNYLQFSTQHILISNYIMTNCQYSDEYKKVTDDINQNFNPDNLYFLLNQTFQIKKYIDLDVLEWQNDILEGMVYIYNENSETYIQLTENDISNFDSENQYYYKISEHYIDQLYIDLNMWDEIKNQLYYKDLEIIDDEESSAGYGFWVDYNFIQTDNPNNLGLGQYKIVVYKDIINNTIRLKRISLGTV